MCTVNVLYFDCNCLCILIPHFIRIISGSSSKSSIGSSTSLYSSVPPTTHLPPKPPSQLESYTVAPLQHCIVYRLPSIPATHLSFPSAFHITFHHSRKIEHERPCPLFTEHSHFLFTTYNSPSRTTVQTLRSFWSHCGSRRPHSVRQMHSTLLSALPNALKPPLRFIQCTCLPSLLFWHKALAPPFCFVRQKPLDPPLHSLDAHEPPFWFTQHNALDPPINSNQITLTLNIAWPSLVNKTCKPSEMCCKYRTSLGARMIQRSYPHPPSLLTSSSRS